MANEMKTCCGGFLVGEGLEMDGKVLKASGSAGGCFHKIVMIGGTTNDGFMIDFPLLTLPESDYTTKEELVDYIEDHARVNTILMGGSYMMDDNSNSCQAIDVILNNIGDFGVGITCAYIDSDGNVHSNHNFLLDWDELEVAIWDA